ncbi:hypothetical protein F5148DRAFT_1252331 [Russula earlei]|uniref:Uncharacterized protein n=1 Tax=Russula earlei TaxID=71964 RepID=A0ACC0TVP0_9AGAM|nr:hypothetical protein F5148DRAFT_1252331 [Russula earlei]
MAPRKKCARCQVCNEKEPKYTCPESGCGVEYCSVPCYKQHKETSCRVANNPGKGTEPEQVPFSCDDGDKIRPEVALRPLTSLKWPYVPEESAYPDPLKRDDPKPLRTAQYEAIATSPAVRAALEGHPRMKEVLRTMDGLSGSAREEALQASLGIWGDGGVVALEEEVRDAMRGLAEAIDGAVRGSVLD